MSDKNKLGMFLLSQLSNLILIIVLVAEDYWGPPPKGSNLRHWIVAVLVVVIVADLVSIFYLLYKRHGNARRLN